MRNLGRAVRQAGAGIGVLMAAVLAGCAHHSPDLDLMSPVGTWRASAPDTGVLEIDLDGTLTIEDSSFNVSELVDSRAGYNATGTWELLHSPVRVGLAIGEGQDGQRASGGGRYALEFTHGVIMFRDSEDTVGITFVYDTRNVATAGSTAP
jgi:hypothetical protein